jgi:hypothetical protein
MGFCRFFYDNKWLSGTALDASTENANFPVSFTRHRWFTRTWRSVGLNGAGEWVRLNRGASSPAITAAAIRFNNFSNGAAVRIQGGADGTNWTYDEAWSANNKVMVHFPTTPQSLDWWRVLVVDAGNADGFSEIGCMFLGTYYQPVRNFNYGMSLNKEDPSLISFSEGGQLSSIFREKFFNKEYGFEHFKTSGSL